MALLRGACPVGELGVAEAQGQRGTRVQLVLDGGAALRASQLVPERDYVFLYPFEGTPCFLLDLGRPVPAAQVTLRDGGSYAWPGGVGRGRSIVAYAAICPHTYTHPTREAAMIHYFPADQPATVAGRGGIITCCVHGSAFDPARGAVPLQPPAELPLAAVLLEWDEATDGLHAVGVAGRPRLRRVLQGLSEDGARNSRRQHARVGARPLLGSYPAVLSWLLIVAGVS